MRAIVGREEELAAVAAFLDEPGGAASLVLEGEAGSGKTALLRAAFDRGGTTLL